jgi:hypothetical protein
MIPGIWPFSAGMRKLNWVIFAELGINCLGRNGPSVITADFSML